MIINANALAIPLATGSIHMVVTSPPYWALRDYGVSGQLGLERTPEEYVANMVQVFREVWRVLRDDGTLWLNIGDSYAANGYSEGGHNFVDGGKKRLSELSGKKWSSGLDHGLKPKDLVGIPWRLAFALQADGWYLRSDIIWSKPNPMPESVTDRPTKSHEYIFLLTKRERYYYDAIAVSEEGAGRENFGQGQVKCFANKDRNDAGRIDMTVKGYRNLRTVWTMATEPYSGAHYATFPTALAERCIKAGTSERGVCPKCGAGWVRVVEKGYRAPAKEDVIAAMVAKGVPRQKANLYGNPTRDPKLYADNPDKTLGWQPTCNCSAAYNGMWVAHDDPAYVPYEPIPALVFDPFVGSGTTVKVAYDLGRRGVGLDLNVRYLAEQAKTRIHAGHTGRLF